MAVSDFGDFARFLKELRVRLGYRSARAFHTWLSAQADLGCNYSYYARFEAGDVLPSMQLLAMIADLLPGSEADALTLAYCRAQFPKRKKLFGGAAASVREVPKAAPKPAAPGPEVKERRLLTRLQVDRMVKSKAHYLLFLMTTLARRPLVLSAVEDALGLGSLRSAFTDLREVKILRGEPKGFTSAFPDMNFPKAEGDSGLRAVYSRMDAWDRQLAEELKFTPLLERFLFIRVSSRYVGLIQDHCELLLKLIRSAEDVDPDHNDEVVSFSLKLHTGRLPG